MRPDGPRPTIIGPDSGPEPPFPLRMKGDVVSGFGRGSKELGIPTANIPVDGVPWIADCKSGVYFGWSCIRLPADHPDRSSPSVSPPSASSADCLPAAKAAEGYRIYPMVMSIGYNPFYKNTVRSAEVHVLHEFKKDFYGSQMAISILGFIRPEYDYVSVESLIEDIKTDIEVTKTSLKREAWERGTGDAYLWGEDVHEG
ncbi:Riboflavin kinase [Hyphodiscus hymeniophilus]|uniref:Riboflavin kinase n=1 Tax=Hyphodiscus hymeniophilus TaxID=353542 RepID=A0A9P6VPL3_9HELO|nr:Riboflavin kinase [Hyphodiscus hymeniophilus]